MIVGGMEALPYVIVADDAFPLRTGSLEALSFFQPFVLADNFQLLLMQM